MKRKPKLPRDANRIVGVVEIDAATVARLRRKARRAVRPPDMVQRGPNYGEALALARDLLRVLDGGPGRRR